MISYQIKQLEQVIKSKPISSAVTEVILHHTWSPNLAMWKERGGSYQVSQAMVEGIKTYHMKEKGQSNIGYHWVITPDGLCWEGRPMVKQPSYSLGGHVLGRNDDSLGVAIVLNGDKESPTVLQAQAIGTLLGTLLKKLDILPEKNFSARSGFHRDYATKTCPGSRISKGMVIGWVKDEAARQSYEAEGDVEPDVSPWAESAVEWAVEKKLLTGFPDGMIHGRENLTREQMAVILLRFYDLIEAERG